jgi:hypothetical protein
MRSIPRGRRPFGRKARKWLENLFRVRKEDFESVCNGSNGIYRFCDRARAG